MGYECMRAAITPQLFSLSSSLSSYLSVDILTQGRGRRDPPLSSFYTRLAGRPLQHILRAVFCALNRYPLPRLRQGTGVRPSPPSFHLPSPVVLARQVGLKSWALSGASPSSPLRLQVNSPACELSGSQEGRQSSHWSDSCTVSSLSFSLTRLSNLQPPQEPALTRS